MVKKRHAYCFMNTSIQELSCSSLHSIDDIDDNSVDTAIQVPISKTCLLSFLLPANRGCSLHSETAGYEGQSQTDSDTGVPGLQEQKREIRGRHAHHIYGSMCMEDNCRLLSLWYC